MSKVVLITGANRGIGFEVAKELLCRNYKVILSARNNAAGILAVDSLKTIRIAFCSFKWILEVKKVLLKQRLN